MLRGVRVRNEVRSNAISSWEKRVMGIGIN